MNLIDFIEKLLDVELEEYQKVAITNFKSVEYSKKEIEKPLPIPPPVRIKRDWGL